MQIFRLYCEQKALKMLPKALCKTNKFGINNVLSIAFTFYSVSCFNHYKKFTFSDIALQKRKKTDSEKTFSLKEIILVFFIT